jgi:hypothetical protein
MDEVTKAYEKFDWILLKSSVIKDNSCPLIANIVCFSYKNSKKIIKAKKFQMNRVIFHVQIFKIASDKTLQEVASSKRFEKHQISHDDILHKTSCPIFSNGNLILTEEI